MTLQDSPRAARARRSGRRSAAGRDEGTKERLLAAALEIFGEHGYRDASLRAICRRAQANDAAVNYHFRSKEGLYREVLRRAFERLHRERPLEVPVGPPADRAEARRRLEAVLRQIVGRLLEPRSRPHEVLILQELLHPSVALDEVVEEFVRPRLALIASVFAPFLPGASEREVTLRVLGLLGQVLFHRWAGAVALKLLGEGAYGPRLVQEIADLVVRATERALGITP